MDLDYVRLDIYFVYASFFVRQNIIKIIKANQMWVGNTRNGVRNNADHQKQRSLQKHPCQTEWLSFFGSVLRIIVFGALPISIISVLQTFTMRNNMRYKLLKPIDVLRYVSFFFCLWFYLLLLLAKYLA